jgi:hypothetical protein
MSTARIAVVSWVVSLTQSWTALYTPHRPWRRSSPRHHRCH